MSTIAPPEQPVGELLRSWRERRRLSQLDLDASGVVSARHLSALETGRSRPTSRMILHLSEHLDVPLRERNRLLLAGGYAPAYPESTLDAPGMSAVHEAIELVLDGLRPTPALVIDRHWDLVAANAGLAPLLDGLSPELLEPPINVLRLALHPDGLAGRTANLVEWRAHLLGRLAREVDASGDPALAALLDELVDLPAPAGAAPGAPRWPGQVVVPLVLRHGDVLLRFMSTTTVFGTPQDVTVDELAIEAFFPADAATAAALAAVAAPG